MLWIGVISLFPDMLQACQYGITGKAIKTGQMALHTWNPRDFTSDPYRSVDDKPYGGGPGMLMQAPPVYAAIKAAKQAAPVHSQPLVIYLSPQGQPYCQAIARELTQHQALILLAGRYEGIDERLMQVIDREYSIGDYILSGGELPAMVVIDTLARLLPNVLGNAASVHDDSLSKKYLLKYPQYTTPANWQGQTIPPILLSGHHQAIAKWRIQQSLIRTWLKRPDLLLNQSLANTDYAQVAIEIATQIAEYLETRNNKAIHNGPVPESKHND